MYTFQTSVADYFADKPKFGDRRILKAVVEEQIDPGRSTSVSAMVYRRRTEDSNSKLLL